MRCMSCKIEWGMVYVIQTFPKAWLDGEYRARREEVLLEREKALLVSAMPLVEEERMRRKAAEVIDALVAQRKAMKKSLKALEDKIIEARAARWRKEAPAKRKFVKACPAEGCKGFLGNVPGEKEWRCGVCDTHVCPDCFETVHEGVHACKPEDIATAMAIKKETRTCPSCGVCIYKTEGCDQMWCTQCHIAFSWRTGAVEKGVIHNPHYYDHVRNNGLPRNIGDVPLGGLPAMHVLYRHFRTMKFGKDAVMLDLHRFLNHVLHYELTRYPVQEMADDLVHMRVSYLMGELDAETWKNDLYKTEKTKERNRDIRLLYDEVMRNGVAIVNRGMAAMDRVTMDGLEEEIEVLRTTSNEALMGHYKRFGIRSGKQINKVWVLEPAKV